tara:strand:+ start:1903 stop:2811 length:909 start_codon:yes stop_codon:yes gene_type:complete
MHLAPIIVFTFNRVWHTRQTFEALLGNEGAAQSDVTVYCDGARDEKDADAVAEVRAYVKTVTGFNSISIVERERNYGLAASIIDGVSQTVQKHERVIVLEDDMVSSKYFLRYMNEALDKYADEDKVACVHGYCYPVKAALPEAFFLQGADCWGWATWARAWDGFNPDGKALLEALQARNLTQSFDYDGTYPYVKMLKKQILGKNNSWAIRWHASAFLAGKLTLYPGRSLIHNIGNDDSGTHAAGTSNYDVEVSATPISLENIEVSVSARGRDGFVTFFKASHRSLAQRIWARLRALLRQARS